jgi:hypothetical protein
MVFFDYITGQPEPQPSPDFLFCRVERLKYFGHMFGTDAAAVIGYRDADAGAA